MLGFRDSGMAGSPANEHPECFHMADIDAASGWVDDLALVTGEAEFAALVRDSGAVLIGYRDLRDAMRAG